MQDREYAYIKLKILALTGVDLGGYKSPQMQRRLRTFLLRSGQPNWPALFRAIQNDPQQIGQLKNYLTINVTAFFRDPDKYRRLQEIVLPELLRGRPKLDVWSAGCSHGHEPYSLAILLAEVTSPYRPHFILATDIDRSSLDKAQAGGPYSSEELEHVPPPLIERYFEQRASGYGVNKRLQRKITFRYHDMLAEPFILPLGGDGYDLIVCRNVVIYFTAEVKCQLYRRFHDALRPGGILFVGGTEIIPRAADMGFEIMEMSFYRRTSGRVSPITPLRRSVV
ncbi:MAG: protein-glutamate O-methyltransferase CheR [Thermoflexales bacterium]|nr:protein-glutamate O-methyltransferase CheR [Thermoflexales bacterium]